MLNLVVHIVTTGLPRVNMTFRKNMSEEWEPSIESMSFTPQRSNGIVNAVTHILILLVCLNMACLILQGKI